MSCNFYQNNDIVNDKCSQVISNNSKSCEYPIMRESFLKLINQVDTKSSDINDLVLSIVNQTEDDMSKIEYLNLTDESSDTNSFIDEVNHINNNIDVTLNDDNFEDDEYEDINYDEDDNSKSTYYDEGDLTSSSKVLSLNLENKQLHDIITQLYLSISQSDIIELDQINNIDQYYPIHLAISNIKVISYLIYERLCNVNKFDINNETPLMLAVKKGHISTTEFLIDISNYKVLRADGKSALHYAAIYNKLDVLKLLIDKVDDVYMKDSDGNNILHLACINGNYDIVAYLLSETINFNVFDVNNTQKTAILLCNDRGYDYISDLINKFILNSVSENSINDSFLVNEIHAAICEGNISYLDLVAGLYRYNPVHIAVVNNDINMLKYLVDKKYCDINMFDDNLMTPLILAIEKSNDEIIIYLINHDKININIICKDNNRAIHFAVINNRLRILIALINKIDDIYAKNNDGNNILLLAAQTNNIDIIEYLISINYNVNDANNLAYSALHLSVINNNLNVLRVLIPKVDDIYITDKNGYNILHLASQHKLLDILKYLLEINYDYTKVNKSNQTALKMNSILHDIVIQDRLDILKLIDQVKYLYYTSRNGDSILHTACQYKKFEIIKYLKSIKFDIDTKNSKDHNSLENAMYENKIVVFKFLIDEIYDRNRKDSNGNTLLHIACKYDNIDIITYLLLSNNFDVNAVNYDNDNALHIAVSKNNFKVLKSLLNKVQDKYLRNRKGFNILDIALYLDRHNIAKYLISNDIDIVTFNQRGEEQLNISILNDNKEVCDLIASKLNNDNMYVKNADSNTILHIACRYGCSYMVNNLLSRNYNINIFNKDGFTPFHCSVKYGRLLIVKIFIERSTDLSVKDRAGNDILEIAVSSNDEDMVAFLLSSNNNIAFKSTNIQSLSMYSQFKVIKCFIDNADYKYMKDNYGNNFLHLACKLNNIDVVKYISSIEYNFNALNKYNQNALHMTGKYDIFVLLIDKVDNIYAGDVDGNNLLHLACFHSRLDIVKYLLSNNYKTDITNNKNETAFSISSTKYINILHNVILNDRVDILFLLIDKLDHMSFKDNDGNGLLHLACSIGRIDLLKYLLSKNYDINSVNYKNQTVLHISTVKNDLDIMKLLIDKVSNKYATDIEGNNILHLASKYNYHKIVEYLQSIKYG